MSPGYGFAAIIVAYVGRLHPIGILFSSFIMALFYIGGELAQSRLGLPNAITGVFQGMLLFFLLGADVLIPTAYAGVNRWIPFCSCWRPRWPPPSMPARR